MALKHYQWIAFPVLPLIFLGGCATPPASDPATPVGLASNRSEPMYITPHLNGINACDQGLKEPLNSMPEVIEFCRKNGLNSASLVQAFLDRLEPGGPAGDIQLGYTYTVDILALFEKQDDNWVIRQEMIDQIFNTINEVDRPVVLFLKLNQFATHNPLAKELMTDPVNLLSFANGDIPIDQYFANPIIPWTLLTDESIPINRYRFEGMRAVLQAYQEQPEAIQDRVKAIALGGETHHFFPDFQNGAGVFDNIQITDYSPRSVSDFQAWLKGQFKNIQVFNRATNLSFASWEDIQPPAKNIRTDQLAHYGEHFDSYAHGIIPVFGWLAARSDDGKAAYSDDWRVAIYLNGKRIGYAETGFSRQDVLEARPEIGRADVGFRYLLDFRQLPVGIHEMSVVVEQGDKNYRLGDREITIVNQSQSPPQKVEGSPQSFEEFPPHLLGSLDGARTNSTAYYYNPLAEYWYKYRQSQVSGFINKLWEIAVEQGVSEEKLYSHQIADVLYSDWNPVLFATADSLMAEQSYRKGVNLYGGSTYSQHTFEFLSQFGEYGSPEMHSMLEDEAMILESLKQHYDNGAVFISPFFMELALENHAMDDGKDFAKFKIIEANSRVGSDDLFRAIQSVVAY